MLRRGARIELRIRPYLRVVTNRAEGSFHKAGLAQKKGRRITRAGFAGLPDARLMDARKVLVTKFGKANPSGVF